MFDFSRAMHRLVADIARFSPDLSHLRPSSLLIGLSQARTSRRYGMYAKIVPMRFSGGTCQMEKRGRTYEIDPLRRDGREILYLIYFVLPRFQNLDYKEKMTTVFHELYHISPFFNGDIRRFSGGRYAHTCNKENFDSEARKMAERYLGLTPNLHLVDFLKLSFRKLRKLNGDIMGQRLPIPKLKAVQELVPLPAEENGQLVFLY